MKINKFFFILFFSLVLLLVLNLDIYAANAVITLDKSTVEVGKPVEITVSGNGVQWNLKLKVDGEVLKTNSEFENYEANKNISFSVSYTPKTAGTKNVTLEGSVTEFSDGSTVKSFASKTITVKAEEPKEDNKNQNENTGTTNNGTTNNNTNTGSNSGTTTEQPKTKSTNAYLSTLGVTPKQYDFSNFSKSNLTYSVTVPYEVDELKVLYKTAHSGAKVKVTGNSDFEVGSNNKITVKVTAEDGKTTKTYTIKVTKLAEEEEKPGNIIDEEIEGLYLTSLSIKGVDISPEFSKDTYAYTATLSKNLTEVEINAVANKENASIEISGNTNLVVGENTINVVVKQEGSTVQTVYQITLTKEAALITMPSEENNNFMSNLIDNIKNYVIIAVIVVVLIIAVIVILIILLRKENKRLKNEETEEYNVYENNEDEFKNNQVEENIEEQVKKVEKEEVTNETETKNEGRRTRRKEKGRHSK